MDIQRDSWRTKMDSKTNKNPLQDCTEKYYIHLVANLKEFGEWTGYQ